MQDPAGRAARRDFGRTWQRAARRTANDVEAHPVAGWSCPATFFPGRRPAAWPPRRTSGGASRGGHPFASGAARLLAGQMDQRIAADCVRPAAAVVALPPSSSIAGLEIAAHSTAARIRLRSRSWCILFDLSSWLGNAWHCADLVPTPWGRPLSMPRPAASGQASAAPRHRSGCHVPQPGREEVPVKKQPGSGRRPDPLATPPAAPAAFHINCPGLEEGSNGRSACLVARPKHQPRAAPSGLPAAAVGVHHARFRDVRDALDAGRPPHDPRGRQVDAGLLRGRRGHAARAAGLRRACAGPGREWGDSVSARAFENCSSQAPALPLTTERWSGCSCGLP